MARATVSSRKGAHRQGSRHQLQRRVVVGELHYASSLFSVVVVRHHHVHEFALCLWKQGISGVHAFVQKSIYKLIYQYNCLFGADTRLELWYTLLIVLTAIL